MASPSDPFTVTPVPRLHAESQVPGPSLDEKMAFLRTLDRMTNEEIAADPQSSSLLPELGPDLNILAYAFNFKTTGPTGTSEVNHSLQRANALNKALYNRLSINPGDDIYKYDLIVSTTDLTRNTYGDEFFQDYTQRLGITEINDDHITVLRSVVMDPWVTETTRLSPSGRMETFSFIDTLEREFRKAITSALQEVKPTQLRGY